MAFVFVPVSRDPLICVVEAPQLDPATAHLIELQREQLLAADHGFDGPSLLAAAASPERISVYRTSYAAKLVHEQLADENGRSPLGLGSLCATLLPLSADSRTLWTRRSATVSGAGGWQFGVAGGIEGGETAQAACLREAAEELGLVLADVTALGYCTGPRITGVDLISTVLLDPESAVLRLGDEVVEAAWVSDPETELRPIDPDFVALWRTFPFARLPRA